MGWDYEYPHIPLLLSVKPNIRILLGQELFWTEKKDGSCMGIWLEELKWKKKIDITKFTGKKGANNWLIGDKVFALHISSRYKTDAKSDLDSRVRGTEEFSRILNLLHEHPQFVIYVEACKKGRSVTGAEVYKRNCLFVFDIYDKSAEKFLHYVNVYQHCFHWKIPVVKLWAKTSHSSVKDLLKWKNHALKHCKAVHLEGVVIKAYKIPKSISSYFQNYKRGLLQAKVKLDVPEPKKRKIARGQPVYPPIPDNEILGAIDKAWQELGTKKFRDVPTAMPLIARYVGEECKKHLYSSPKKKLIAYYNEYLERLIEE